jgi:hypothetical protein
VDGVCGHAGPPDDSVSGKTVADSSVRNYFFRI